MPDSYGHIHDNPDFVPAYPEFLSAGTIKGDKVVNIDGDDIGKIEELMIDLHDGRVAYAVLSFGGFLGMGDKLFAIPWQALSLRVHKRAFALNISKDVLERAKGFDRDNLPLTRDELSGTYTYYGYQPHWQTIVTEPTGIPGDTESERMARTGNATSRDNPDFLSASTIKGTKVVNMAGEDLGKIEELMIDLEDGRVAYTVLSSGGGFLGMGSKLFAFPWQAFRPKLQDHTFLLDIPKDVLKKAEGFDKDNWPATNREWLATMYNFYGYQPYWRTEMVENRPGNI
jgi:sporulation protein YlmC with PRC-barrel domain